MARIEARVRDKAQLFTSIAGLELKAFLSTSRADGHARNVYAPFYLWRHSASLTDFLSGPLFGAVIASFGRPAVQDHQVLEFGLGDHGITPSLATFEALTADRAAQPSEIWQWERWAQRQAMALPGAYAPAPRSTRRLGP